MPAAPHKPPWRSRFTRIHSNALIALLFQFLLTTGLIGFLFVLVEDPLDVNGRLNGKADLIIGSLLPIIMASLSKMGDVASRFAGMKDTEPD